MALQVNTPHTSLNGVLKPPTEGVQDEEEFLDQILAIRDAVLAGTHPTIKLPASAIEHLKASLVAQESVWDKDDGERDDDDYDLVDNDAAAAATRDGAPAASTNVQPPSKQFTLPGLNPSVDDTSVNPHPSTISSGLDPIFLEKPESLVRAEGQLKRRRIEREIDEQIHQRKNLPRDRDVEAQSQLDVGLVLQSAQILVQPVSGLIHSKDDTTLSIDTDSYYSSKAGDTWTESSPSQASDRAAGDSTADLERLADPKVRQPLNTRPQAKQPRPDSRYPYASDVDNTDGLGDEEDEEYTPPDVSTFEDNVQNRGFGIARGEMEDYDGDQDDDEYEPGEVTPDVAIAGLDGTDDRSPYHPSDVPIIRNHLTHLAAPQPNRVSPLATAKGPPVEIEMQLVNGRPELVLKDPQPQRPLQSSASPTANGRAAAKAARLSQRRERKKRKRENERETTGSNRRRRHPQDPQTPHPATDEPYIKPEPISPPPFGIAQAASSQQPYPQARPAQVDLSSPRPTQSNRHTQQQRPGPSAVRYEQIPAFDVRGASPAYSYPVQKDNQDLRRYASVHYAQRPASPPIQAAPRPQSPPRVYRGVYPAHSVGHEPIPLVYAPTPPHSYGSKPPRAESPYLRHPPSPQQARERQIVVDADGNRYYAEPIADPRASVAPASYQQPLPELVPEYRAPSRAPYTYGVPPPPTYRHESAAPRGRYEEGPYVEMVDDQGRRFRAYREEESTRYQPEQPQAPPPPPAFGLEDRYAMPPPSIPHSNRQPLPHDVSYHPDGRGTVAPQPIRAGEPPVATYSLPPRAYSVRPEEPLGPREVPPRQSSIAPIQYLPIQQEDSNARYQRPIASSHMPPPPPPPPPSAYPPQRQASVAPMPFIRHELDQPPPPVVRAVSVVPGHEYPQYRSASRATHAPPTGPPQQWLPAQQEPVRYVDAHGLPVPPPQQVRNSSSSYRY